MIYITDQNAFYLRVTAQTKAGSQMADVDLSVIKWLVAQFVRRGRSLQSMEIDSQGRAVIFNSGDLAMGVYGVEFNGYYNGQPWRFFEKKVFAIVDQTVNAVEQSGEINGIPVFDVTLTITLGGEGVPESYVTNAINEHDSDMNAHPYLQERIENAGKVDDVKVNGVSVVDENKEANINITATIDGNVGEPEVDVEQEDGEIRFAFRNMKGETGETGPEGKQGPQGDSAVYNPDDPDTPDFEMASTTGQSTTKAMTQKAVTGALNEQAQILGETEKIENNLSVSWEQGSINYNNGSDVTAQTSIRSLFIYADIDEIYISCSEGYFIKGILSHNSASKSDVDKIIYYGNPSGTGFDTSVTSYQLFGNGKYYRCVVGKVNGENISTSDASNISVKKMSSITKGLGMKATFNDVAKKVSAMRLEPVDEFHGFISFFRGTITTIADTYHTVFIRKYQIDDTSKIYYADLRTPAVSSASDAINSGVAYFDAENNYICSQYIQEVNEQSLTWARLSVPTDTKYIYIRGCDNANTQGYVIPQLYVADELRNDIMSDIGERQLSPIVDFAIVGKGDTLAYSPSIPIRENMHVLVKLEYDSWTIPDPTADTYAIQTREYPITGSKENVGWLQYQFEQLSQYEIITRKAVNSLTISIRASVGEVIHFSIYEVLNEGTKANAKGYPSPNTIIYDTSKVNLMAYGNISGVSTAVEGEEVDSAWAAMFPSSYKPTGKPTQVIAMLHGASGYVTENVMGYASMQKWDNWRNTYLAAGFAVIDINGWGISTQSDEKATHWGCPAALETLDKAFETMRKRYNVADKILLHGSSMGGSLAWGYALTYPSKVLAVGLFSPATTSWVMLSGLHDPSRIAWQYASEEEAIADDFQRIVGFDAILNTLRFKDGLMAPVEQLYGYNVLQYGESDQYVLVGQTLPCPMRIWHGTADPTVPISLSEIITTAYRRGGQNITLRSCPEETHAICTGGTQYVVDEAVEYFIRYAE